MGSAPLTPGAVQCTRVCISLRQSTAAPSELLPVVPLRGSGGEGQASVAQGFIYVSWCIVRTGIATTENCKIIKLDLQGSGPLKGSICHSLASKMTEQTSNLVFASRDRLMRAKPTQGPW